MRKSHLNRESNAYANEVANKSGPDSKVTTFAKKIDSYSNLMPNRQLANLPNETNMQMRKPSRPTGLAELAVPELNAYANEVANKSGPDSKVTTFAKKIDSYSNLMPNRQLANLPNETNMQMRKPSRPTGLAELAVPQL